MMKKVLLILNFLAFTTENLYSRAILKRIIPSIEYRGSLTATISKVPYTAFRSITITPSHEMRPSKHHLSGTILLQGNTYLSQQINCPSYPLKDHASFNTMFRETPLNKKAQPTLSKQKFETLTLHIEELTYQKLRWAQQELGEKLSYLLGSKKDNSLLALLTAYASTKNSDLGDSLSYWNEISDLAVSDYQLAPLSR